METSMNEREQEIRERMEAAGITPLKSETREIKCEFTEAEMAKIAAEMTGHVLEGRKLEEEKKAFNKKMKDLQEAEEEQAQALAVLYKNGFEDRDKLVVVGIDIENKRRIVVDVETGLQLCTEMMLDSDLQTSMKFKENKGKKPAAPKAAAPLEIGVDKVHTPKNAVEVDGEVLTGAQVAEAEFVDADQEPKTGEIVTQVYMTERQEKSAPGFLFVTTAELKVFFTDDPEKITLIEAVKAGRGNLWIKYLNIEGQMNKQILELAVRDLSPTLDGDPGEDQALPDGIEEGEDVE